MYFMSVWLHVTYEVNRTVYCLIHFDERTGRGGKIDGGGGGGTVYVDKITPEHGWRKETDPGTGGREKRDKQNGKKNIVTVNVELIQCNKKKS